MKNKIFLVLFFLLGSFLLSAQCDSLTSQDTISYLQYDATNLPWFTKVDSGVVQVSTQSTGQVILTFQAVGENAILEKTARGYRQGCIGGQAGINSTSWTIYDKDCNVVSNNYTASTIVNPYTNQSISDFYSYTLNPCEKYTAVASWETVDSIGNPCVPDTINFGIGLLYYPLDSIQDCTDYGLSLTNIELKDFKIYPNPASTFINIDNFSEIAELFIYDIEGRIVKVPEKNNFQRVDLSQLPVGFYIIRILDKDKNITTKKLVVKN